MNNKTALTFEEQKQMWINNQKQPGLRHLKIHGKKNNKKKVKYVKKGPYGVVEMPDWKTFYWSQEVRNRDEYKCAICSTHKDLTAHHIFYKKKYPKLAQNMANGITLCKEHHTELHDLNGY